ncbi:MAG: type II toxin-antitoxin system VapC family toxin, partial [Deltaproteobacteria bacterium]|nr:type II toxin-antitoxin system VapC family toxin [Deltaproteobacteria bacterium]
MILYLDTSAIVKLYAAESGTAQTKRLVAAAKRVASTMVAYAETRAALARKYRMRQISEQEFRKCKND